MAILSEQKSAKIIELREEMRRDNPSLRNRILHPRLQHDHLDHLMLLLDLADGPTGHSSPDWRRERPRVQATDISDDRTERTVVMTDKLPNTDAIARQTLPLAERDQVLALHAEEISIARRRVPRGVVRVSKVIQSHEQLVQETLTHQRVEVERIPIGTYVDQAPPIRHDGDVTIISVVEEVVVTERRLLLKEEVRVRTVTRTEDYQEIVSLRSEEAVIERISAVAVAAGS